MKREFGFWFWVHILFIALAALSPMLVSWKLVVIGIIVLEIQFLITGGCILTHIQMGKDENRTFVWHYLRKIYPNLNPETTKFIMRYVIPVFILAVSVLLQVKIGLKPWIKILT